jgi:hypothetical protein
LVEGRGELEWKPDSILPWFVTLLSLNILDILFTIPSTEANPFTIYLWAKLGILPSASVKLGLVLLFGTLCIMTRKVASPSEWNFAGKLLRGILVALVTFYAFIVTWNLTLFLLHA